MTLNIENFYNKNDPRDYIRQPFQLDGKTIATSGKALLILPQHGDYPDCHDKFKSTARSVLERINYVNTHEQFSPLPADVKHPDKTECNTCGGLGKATTDQCPECDGDGEIELTTEYNQYSCECKTCNGAGDITIKGGLDCCKNCNGSGSVYPNRNQIKLLGIDLDANLLALIIGEPDIEVCATFVKESGERANALYFRIKDAAGLIMELRK